MRYFVTTFYLFTAKSATTNAQPFYSQYGENGHGFAFGTANMRLVRYTVYDVATYNVPYTQNGFNLPDNTESHIDSIYLVNDGVNNYDLVLTLYLIVCPQKVAEAFYNNTGFTAYPTGIHNAAVQCFEGLGAQTVWLTNNCSTVNGIVADASETQYYTTLQMQYYSNKLNSHATVPVTPSVCAA